MVRLVVVAVIYAASPFVVRVRNLAHYFLLVAAVLEVKYSEMLLSLYINVDCAVWAAGLVRAAVGAAQRSSFRRVFLLEPGERTVCNYGLARLAYDPSQYIKVVAAFCKNDRGSLF